MKFLKRIIARFWMRSPAVTPPVTPLEFPPYSRFPTMTRRFDHRTPN